MSNNLIQNCDSEQIQFIDLIQPIGSLFAFDALGVIKFAAAGKEFGSSKDWLGKNARGLLDSNYDRIVQTVEGRNEPTTPQLVRNKNAWMSVIAHKTDGLTVVEMESVPDVASLESVQFMNKKTSTLLPYLTHIASSIREWTGYSRVMIYRFAHDWHGEVIAESKAEGADAYLHHHFPASDIPEPARKLFTANWVRMIADVDANNIQLLAAPGAPGHLDLTRSALRSAATIHIEYLRNMHVGSSLTLSIVCDGRLWGLIACHHPGPKYLPAEKRSVCSLIAKIVSSKVTSFEVGNVMRLSEKLAVINSELRTKVKEKDVIDCIAETKKQLLDYVEADGFSFIGKLGHQSQGVVPERLKLDRLVAALERSKQEIVCTSQISKLYPELTDLGDLSAGILAAKVGDNWVIWNKAELVQSVVWAGNPTYKVADANLRISPRKSFASWRQEVHGMSSQWHQHEIDAVARLRQVLEDSLRGRPAPSAARVDATGYLNVLRGSIASQAADLQKHFAHIDLASLESSEFDVG